MIVDNRLKSLTSFVSTEKKRRPLMYVCVNAEEMVATNGQVLAIAPLDEVDAETNLPDTPDLLDIKDGENVLLGKEHIVSAFNFVPKKTDIPIYEKVNVGKTESGTGINAGLPVMQVSGPCVDEQYPDYRSVIPEFKRSIRFALSGRLLKKVCDLAIKHGGIADKIVFEVDASEETLKRTVSNKAVKFDIDDEGRKRFQGIVMPLRIDTDAEDAFSS